MYCELLRRSIVRPDSLNKIVLPAELRSIVMSDNIEIITPESREELIDLALGGKDSNTFDVVFDVQDKGAVREAYVVKCKNGIVVNYDDFYMRRRDPDSLVIADNLPTDKCTHEERFGMPFDNIRNETFNWLKEQKSLICMPFLSGNDKMGLGYASFLVVPTNAAFFALMLADLQGFIPKSKIQNFFRPRAVVYVAPPFRHIYYEGKQVVIHNRLYEMHEVFAYNLYPGPSAKKGIYSVLLNLGEQESWITLHASTVRIITPYELTVTIMHEGASGGGKSEMHEEFHRQPDGRLLLGVNTVTNEQFLLTMLDACELRPVTDDMALCHPSLVSSSNKLMAIDAEDGWFVRVDHIREYGTQPDLEKKTIHPEKPLVFLNLDGTPGSTCLIWEPIMDAPGKPCPNPRIVLPRKLVTGVEDNAVEIDVRSFGIRTPPTTREKPNYGIIGMLHVLPPALAWLWRLVAPRGHANPSIVDSGGMQSEGVGSYWPFATGKMVDQANLLLEQIVRTLSTRYLLIPNQHIGAYYVGFAGQWAAREYIARRGGVKFRPESLTIARCPLLGYALASMKIDGTQIPKGFLQVEAQPEVGIDGYDAGAKILSDFFKREVANFLSPELLPLGRRIIDVCLNDGTLNDYYDLIPKL
jgi:hypothetical protein